MVSTANTSTHILSILQSDPFRRFYPSDLQSQLPAQSVPDLNKAMVELYEGTEQGIIGEDEYEADISVRVGL